MDIFGRVAVAFGLLSLSGLAFAVPMSWEDSHDPDDFLMSASLIGPKDTHNWTFDITNDGFNPGSDLVTSYGIALDLYDDRDRDSFHCLGGGCEFAFFNQPGVLGDWVFEVDNEETVGYSLSGLVSINLDGTLDVSLTAKSGDFYFGGASLVANGHGHVSEVPEPGSLALLGLGIAALGMSRRRRS